MERGAGALPILAGMFSVTFTKFLSMILRDATDRRREKYTWLSKAFLRVNKPESFGSARTHTFCGSLGYKDDFIKRGARERELPRTTFFVRDCSLRFIRVRNFGWLAAVRLVLICSDYWSDWRKETSVWRGYFTFSRDETTFIFNFTSLSLREKDI